MKIAIEKPEDEETPKEIDAEEKIVTGQDAPPAEETTEEEAAPAETPEKDEAEEVA